MANIYQINNDNYIHNNQTIILDRNKALNISNSPCTYKENDEDGDGDTKRRMSLGWEILQLDGK